MVSLLIFLFMIQYVAAGNYILDVTVNCGSKAANSPVINILTDVVIVAEAKCTGGDQTFTSKDKVHFTLPGSFSTPRKQCRWQKHKGISTYTVDVHIRYGEAGSLILTKDKITTVVCTFDQHGKDDTPSNTVIDGYIAPRELPTIIGTTLPSNQFELHIHTVKDANVVGAMNIDRKYSVYSKYVGSVANVGLKPVSCNAVSGKGVPYAVLRAGCGDGIIFKQNEGFTTTGKTFRSPYFQGFHLEGNYELSFECNVTLCPGKTCEGSSCSIHCNVAPSFSISNAKFGSCDKGFSYKEKCKFVCLPGYVIKGDGISTCGPDGRWTRPKMVCTGKSCGTPPTMANGSRKFGLTTYKNTALYSCNRGYTMKNSARSTVTCLVTGKWSATPSCIRTGCGIPPSISNGSRSYRSVTFGSLATYKCNKGYIMANVIRKSVRCLPTGKWSPAPSCFPAACKLYKDSVKTLNVKYYGINRGVPFAQWGCRNNKKPTSSSAKDLRTNCTNGKWNVIRIGCPK